MKKVKEICLSPTIIVEELKNKEKQETLSSIALTYHCCEVGQVKMVADNMPVKVGDKIIFHTCSGKIKDGDKEYLVMDITHIIAVIIEPEG